MKNDISLIYKEKLSSFCNVKNLVNKFTIDEMDIYEEIVNESSIKKILDDKELMYTVKIFFENNLNISSTSKTAYMHRNTLIYRLEKIKRETGFNIKQFSDASLFNILLKIKEIIDIKKQ